MNEPWWVNHQYDMGSLENCDDYVEQLMGRPAPEGGWEFASVRWRYLVPHLLESFQATTIQAAMSQTIHRRKRIRRLLHRVDTGELYWVETEQRWIWLSGDSEPIPTHTGKTYHVAMATVRVPAGEHMMLTFDNLVSDQLGKILEVAPVILTGDSKIHPSVDKTCLSIQVGRARQVTTATVSIMGSRANATGELIIEALPAVEG